jgi:G3E family GTPase
MNKRDKLDPATAAGVLALVQAHAPHADVHWTVYGDLDLDLCRRVLTDPAPTHQSCACGHDHQKHTHHEHRALPASFYTVALPLPELPDRATAERLLSALPEAVIRAKGFAHLADGGWHVLHRVYDAADVIPYDAQPNAGAVLICIGQHLDAAAIRDAVAAHLPASMPMTLPRYKDETNR